MSFKKHGEIEETGRYDRDRLTNSSPTAHRLTAILTILRIGTVSVSECWIQWKGGTHRPDNMNLILRWIFLIVVHVILPLVYLWSDSSLISELLHKDEWWEVVIFSPVNPKHSFLSGPTRTGWLASTPSQGSCVSICSGNYNFIIEIVHRIEALNWIITACMGETSCREFWFWIIFSLFFPISIVIWNIGHAFAGPKHFDK